MQPVPQTFLAHRKGHRMNRLDRKVVLPGTEEDRLDRETVQLPGIA